MKSGPASPGLRRICLFLLAANAAYCLVTSLGGWAPAWGMFSRIERLEFTLTDRGGAPVDLRRYVPPVFYFANGDVLAETAACACKKAPGSVPWTLRVPSAGLERTLCLP
ncbi:MAG: hypothetical protein HYZ75_14835 [Elusimicrobia bacterium]|nr:hypothetical protein [Elusimicrobiota bacterium]